MSTQEIKGNLARLLATENLVVEHKSVSTASFDVDNRILTLPNWDRASNVVYDLLVGHEVGHALYTPVWDNFSCPRDYVNVTEDARIEKLMKRRYPGLRKTFYCGYSELNGEDFFGIADEDLDVLNYIDRVNLHFKIGTAGVTINFAPDEQELVDECAAAETFDEAVAVAEKMWKLAKQQQKEMEQLADIPQSGGDGRSDSSETQNIGGEQPEQQEGESMTHEEMLEEAERREEEDEEVPGSAGGDISESMTQESFDRASQGLSNRYSGRTTYVDIPKFNPDDFVVDWTTIHDWIDECSDSECDYSFPDGEYNSFKKSIQKEVNYLVKEFECKKSADAYSRAMTSRTGVLDTSKLHTYKFNEDLFKKVTIIPEGKNHGMLFILDWSGSMGTVMLPTIKQLLTLAMFCKKVGIPFEVYAFSNEWIPAERVIAGKTAEISNEEYYSYKDHVKKNEVCINKSFFRMLNIISSRSNSKNFDRQCRNLWREVFSMCYYVSYQSTIGMGLSGTPLNESIMVMKDIIPQFKKSTGVNKVNLMILTDGEGCGTGYGAEVIGYDGDSTRIAVRRIESGDVVLRDRKLGRMYARNNGFTEATNLFIQNLKENNPGVNVMGFRIIESSGLTNFYQRYCINDYDSQQQLQKQWKKEKSAVLPNPIAYDALYAIHAKATNMEDTELEVDAGASKTQVRSAFRKMLSKKQNNKKILSSFITLIS
ncbi:peptidase [Synechococcus phage S-H9-2]|uniref:Peptidase n=1 Tax=Synechococcus phage S-H9-2 TaxID=2783669 RepID=A0A873WJU0_9CAUD|nr:peptidase [Synechococcus phage S-H9-2]QPB08335.1 peptidase [Synechococcus phage S-H9-2]